MKAAAELKYENIQSLVVLHSRRLFYAELREAVGMLLLAVPFPLVAGYWLLSESVLPERESGWNVTEAVQMLSCLLLSLWLVACCLLENSVLLPLAVLWGILAAVAGVSCFVCLTTRARAEMRRRQAEWLSSDVPAHGSTPAVRETDGTLLLNAPVRGLYVVVFRVKEVTDLPFDDPAAEPAPAYCAIDEKKPLCCRFIYRLEAGQHRLSTGLKGITNVTLTPAPYREK